MSDTDFALNKSFNSLTTTNVGDTHTFYDADNNEVSATLCAVGDHCYVWIANDNSDDSASSTTDNKISKEQAEAVATKFSNTIYDPETAVFGAEYTGATLENLVADSDKISIFIYDIDGDYSSTQTGGTFGFFWAKDLYTDDSTNTSANNNLRSNETEMFYVDANLLDQYTDMMYSTLAHEFQHMLHFVNKNIAQGLSSSTWFNEMLSMVCEDMMQSKLSISDNDSPKSRLSYFNNYYNWGLGSWYTDDAVLISYANSYAFGAYLARNYGGAAFINELATNDSVDFTSISDALSALGYDRDTVFDAFAKWAQTLVYTDATEDHPSYNREAEATVGSYDFTFSAIDLMDWGTYLTEEDYNNDTVTYGPMIYGTSDSVDLAPTSFSVHAISDNSDVTSFTGDVTLDITTRSSDNEIWYILIK
ncbi:MAG: hypothetical protein BKP49_07890 [Treponema sp. CETP13]|nr:MAG: hypothetical protein BKP49_07890 [Treponema sp. CETP13]